MNRVYITKKVKAIFLSAAVFLLLGNCTAFKSEEDFLISPTSPSPEKITADMYLSQAEIAFSGFVRDIGVFGSNLLRLTALTGGATYDQAYQPVDFDNDVWDAAYVNLLVNCKKGGEIALKNRQYVHCAIFETIKAYAAMLLVDYFGDIPYAEALQGTSNPKIDTGKYVYTAALASLQNALGYLNETPSSVPKNDLYYASDTAKWRKLINSLKLKMFVQTRLVTAQGSKDSINAMIARKEPFIEQPSEDFQFQYGKNVTSPDSRHPKYASNYTANGAADYLGIYGMNRLREEGKDPRWRFLLYRQSDVNTANTNSLPCSGANKPSHFSADDLYCNDGFFWGRDHGDNSNIPPDKKDRTTWGLYPVGGQYDNNQLKSVDGDRAKGALGAGVQPILTSSLVKLYRAEAKLKLSTNDAPDQDLYKGAIEDFSKKLLSFASTINYSGTVDTSSAVYGRSGGYGKLMASYIAEKTTAYATASADLKLKLIIAEWYKDAWGIGTEQYNNYRRTGFPNDLQPMLATNPSAFPRVMYYPQNAVLNNINLQQRQRSELSTQRVFWDDGSTVLK